MKKIVFNIFLILIVINLSSCLTGAFTDYWFDTNDVQETIEDDVDADLDETSTIGSSSTAGNPALILPPIAYVPDAENYYPVVGQVGAVSDFEDGDLVAVSSSEFDDALACVEPAAQGARLKAQGEENGDRWSAGSLVRGIAGVAGSQGRRVAGKSSYGDVILNAVKDLVISTAHADVDTCEDDGTTTYCPISDDGSYECFASFDTESVSRVYVAVVDDTCTAVSEQEEVTVQANLHYLASAPTDIKVMDGTVYSAAGDNLVKINSDESGVFTTAGDYITDYQDADTDIHGGLLDYSSTDSAVGVLNESLGIQIYEKDGDTITYISTSTVDGATSYTFMRPINVCLYFGYEQESSTEAWLMYAPVNYIDMLHEKIYILNNNDEDDETNTLYHTKTLAYDSTVVDAEGRFTVVAFEDNDNNIRTRVVYDTGHNDGDRYDGNVWKTTEEASVKDLVTYYDDNASNIYFAMLDDSNNKLRLGSYSSVDSTPTRNLDDANDINVGSNPQAMYYSETSGKLYVLNQTGKSISIVSLMQDATNPYAFDSIPEVTTLDLDSYITDIDNIGITLVPNAITLETTSERLVISDTATNGAIVVDVSTHETAL